MECNIWVSVICFLILNQDSWVSPSMQFRKKQMRYRNFADARAGRHVQGSCQTTKSGGQSVDSRWTVGGQSVDCRWTLGGQSVYTMMMELLSDRQ